MARKTTVKPTASTYAVLQKAYDHFNKHIFKGTLPQCLITLSNEMRQARGYYRNHAVKDKEGQIIDEIALNPFTFTGRTDEEIFSTLVHEMVHLWQHHFGELKTKTHHDKEWAAKMEEVGLMPSNTGAPGGKRTGRKVSHYIIDDGIFDLASQKFLGVIEWRGAPIEHIKKGSKRTKYTCPCCATNAYGKPDIHLVCGDCQELMTA